MKKGRKGGGKYINLGEPLYTSAIYIYVYVYHNGKAPMNVPPVGTDYIPQPRALTSSWGNMVFAAGSITNWVRPASRHSSLGR